MTGTRKWNTGIAARGSIYVANDNKVYAFRVPAGGTPTPTPTATPTATVSPSVTPTPSEPPCSVNGSQPACDSTVFAQLTDFIADMSAPVDPGTVQPSDFTVNGIPADSDIISGGGVEITFHFNASPVGQGVNFMDIPAGAFSCLFTGRPFEGFHCTFTYQPSTPTPTPRPTPAPRPHLTPRPRPTPPPRPGARN